MSSNRHHTKISARRVATVAAALVTLGLAGPFALHAQDAPFATPLPVCAVPPSPSTDTWPAAATDSLGSTAGGAVSFSAATLLSNDTGTGLTVNSVGPASLNGGAITGTGPFTFTPAPGFVGADVIPYEIKDASAQTTMGLIKIAITAAAVDATAPVVSISAPIAGTVTETVTVVASASDNVRVAGVAFFDGTTPVGAEIVTAPFETTWVTTGVTNGSHSLTAVARDAAGNTTTSAPVLVNVSNVTLVAVPDVVGMSQVAAQGAITDAGFTLGSVTTTNSAMAAGMVLNQTPLGTTRAATGAAVALTVSLGPANVYVPNVVNLTQAAATTKIQSVGLAVGTVTRTNSTTIATGNVISTGPVGDTSVAPGTVVSLLISIGPANVLVPDVVTLTQAVATTNIQNAGLVVGAVTMASSTTVAPGSVISTNPTGGGSVPRGTIVALVVSAPVAPPAPGGLVLALGFDEASGLTAIDSSASAMNGTIRQATRVTGKFGGALSFDGVDDWVTVTDVTASPLDLTTGLTLEAWVNPAVMSGWETVLMKERGTAGAGLLAYALYAHDGAPLAAGAAKPAGYVRVNPVASTTDRAVRGAAALPLNTWTHIATTYDGANQRFYVNGVLVGTTPGSGAINVANGAIRIGGNNSSTGEFFQGLIDEVRVYNRALSASEIASDMSTAVVR